MARTRTPRLAVAASAVALFAATAFPASASATPHHPLKALETGKASYPPGVICVYVNSNYSGNGICLLNNAYKNTKFNLTDYGLSDGVSSYEIFTDNTSTFHCAASVYRDTNEQGPYNVIGTDHSGFHGHRYGNGVANLAGTSYQHGGGAANDTASSVSIFCQA